MPEKRTMSGKIPPICDCADNSETNKALLSNRLKPEWAPDNSGKEFASFVVGGSEQTAKNALSKNKAKGSKRGKPTSEELAQGVISRNLTLLSRTITLIESNSQLHTKQAQEVLKLLLPRSGNSIRIAVTGSPGVGKSSFIESFGLYLCEHGHRVAVLAIDPSSTLTRGSILGDKTRMERLSRHKNSFIRPSPSGGALGGVARKTRETILVCESAGYDIILIETVGVGQSEVTVRTMADFFLLLLLPGAGDDLQGIKKGVVELADLLVVNKADGALENKAELTRQAYGNALQMLMPYTEGWLIKSLKCSSLNETGIEDIWTNVKDFEEYTKRTGIFDSRRQSQMLNWFRTMLDEEVLARFYGNLHISNKIQEIRNDIMAGAITPTAAVEELLKNY